MSKYVTISGETFEIIKPRKYKPQYFTPSRWDYMNIWQAYEKPSYAKECIWNYWNSFMGDEVYKFGIPVITSRNCFAFSITFNVFDAQTLEWLGIAHITRDHNRLYLA